MDMIDGLAGTLAGMKEDAMDAAKMAGGVLLGVSIAKVLDEKLISQVENLNVRRTLGGAVPLVVGLALFSMGRGRFPALAGANGLGMMGYGAGKFIKWGLEAAKQDTLTPYIGLGAVDNYEFAGLGYDLSVNRYLRNGPTLMGLGYDRSPGAPVFVEQVSGAPTQFQTLPASSMAGAPTTIEGLHGLSATLM